MERVKNVFAVIQYDLWNEGESFEFVQVTRLVKIHSELWKIFIFFLFSFNINLSFFLLSIFCVPPLPPPPSHFLLSLFYLLLLILFLFFFSFFCWFNWQNSKKEKKKKKNKLYNRIQDLEKCLVSLFSPRLVTEFQRLVTEFQ